MLYDIGTAVQMAVRASTEALRLVDVAAEAIASHTTAEPATVRVALHTALAVGGAAVGCSIALGWTTLARVTGIERATRFLDANTNAPSTLIAAAVILYAFIFPERIPLLQLGATLALTLTVFRALRHLEDKIDVEADYVLQSLAGGSGGGGVYSRSVRADVAPAPSDAETAERAAADAARAPVRAVRCGVPVAEPATAPAASAAPKKAGRIPGERYS